MGRTNATACYRELGAELKKRRKAAGITARQVAEYTGWHHTKVSRIETGHSAIGPVDVIHYLGACGVYRAQALDLLDLCREAQRHQGYWLSPQGEWLEDSVNTLIFHEATADRMTSYEPLLVPGLLQTARYARIRLARSSLSLKEVDALVRIRMERQRILHQPQNKPCDFFVHEQALRLSVGGPRVMQEQLLNLVLVASLPNVTLRVVPASAEELSIFGGPFRLFEYLHHRPLVFLDGIETGLFLEDSEYVERYRQLIPGLEAVALDEGESRKFAAELADAHDRGSKPNGGIYHLEEEYL